LYRLSCVSGEFVAPEIHTGATWVGVIFPLVTIRRFRREARVSFGFNSNLTMQGKREAANG